MTKADKAMTSGAKAGLYNADFFVWAEQQAALLKQRQFEALDLENLIEEVGSLGKSDRRVIASQLTRLLIHLLKWQYQPQYRSSSWQDSISDARIQIQLVIEDSPSLKHYPQDVFDTCYTKARKLAARETQLPLDTFPTACPLSIEQVLDTYLTNQ